MHCLCLVYMPICYYYPSDGGPLLQEKVTKFGSLSICVSVSASDSYCLSCRHRPGSVITAAGPQFLKKPVEHGQLPQNLDEDVAAEKARVCP